MIVIDKKVTLPKMGLLICNWLGSANDPIDPFLSFSETGALSCSDEKFVTNTATGLVSIQTVAVKSYL